MRPNSFLHEELIREISHGSPEDRFRLLITAIADRLAECRLNPVKTSDLLSVLREEPTRLCNAVLRKPMLGD